MLKSGLKSTILFFLIFLFGLSHVWAENDSSLIRVLRAESCHFFENPDSLHPIDTNIDFFHQYESEFYFNGFTRNNGSIASPLRSLYFTNNPKVFFNTGLNWFDALFSSPYQTRIYDTYTPYFRFRYIQGNLEMQKFEALHSRNISPFLNVTIDYKTTRNDGFYQRQFSKLGDLNLNTSYRPRSGNYYALFIYQYRKAVHEENGGITNDSLFGLYSQTERYGVDVFLDQGKATRKQHILTFNHKLNFAAFDPDSVQLTHRFKTALNHSVTFLSDHYNYLDESPSSSYYNSFFIDSFSTSDSLYFTRLSNHLFFSFEKPSISYLAAGAIFENGKTVQNGMDSSFSNIIAKAQAIRYWKTGKIDITAHYVLSGNNQNNYSFLGEMTLFPSENTDLGFTINSKRVAVPLFQNRLYSNHLKWDNHFMPVSSNSLEGMLFWKNFNTHFVIRYSLVNQYIYFNKNMEPEQLESRLSVVQLNLRTHFTAGHFHFLENLAWQKTPYHAELGLPEWLINSTNYYENLVFSGNMKMQAGIDIRLSQAYDPLGYFAPFGVYYHQDYFHQNIYPVVDLFVNAAVKRMRIFVKYEHINQGFPEGNFFIRPYYPYDSRTLRFGFDWMFFD